MVRVCSMQKSCVKMNKCVPPPITCFLRMKAFMWLDLLPFVYHKGAQARLIFLEEGRNERPQLAISYLHSERSNWQKFCEGEGFALLISSHRRGSERMKPLQRVRRGGGEEQRRAR